MGQALRRAAGKAIETTSSSSPKPKTVVIVKQRPPVGPAERAEISETSGGDALDSGGGGGETGASDPSENVLEERDPSYDAMLNQMVGRIKTKPGGKLEMGEYKRPLPKLRDTKPDSGRYEERPAGPGTLNVAQLRHIILLHRGKAEDHNGPMEVERIAEKYRVDVAEVRRILQFVSLPPEDSSKQKDNP